MIDKIKLTGEETAHGPQICQREPGRHNEFLRPSVTEQENSEDHYREFYDLAPVGCLSLDHQGRIEEINRTGAAQLGVQRNKLRHYSFSYFVAAEDRERWCQHFLKVLGHDGTHTCELALERSDGSRIDVRLDCVRLTNAEAPTQVRVALTDITGRKQADQVLRQYQRIVDTAIDGFYMTDTGGYILKANAAYAELVGYSMDELRGMHIGQLAVNVQSRDEVKLQIARVLAKGHERIETRYRHRDGHEIDIEVSVTFMPESQQLFAFCHDITKRKVTEEALRTQEEFFRLISENVDDLIAVIDLEGRRLYNSPSYAKLFGDVGALKGSNSFAEIHPDDVERVNHAFRDTVKTGRGHRLNYRFVLPDGSIHHMESCGGLIRSQGQALSVVVVSRDMTERMRHEEKIRHLAFYDALTQLPNRRLLYDRLEQAMATSKRSGRYCALMLLDLDNFKPLNDTHGHGVGDRLLVEVARRISRCVRAMDTVARFGGDEFVVLVSELDVDKRESTLQSRVVAEKILTILARPYVLHCEPDGAAGSAIACLCTASIGTVLFVDHEARMDDILRRADMAMYRAKEEGGNLIRSYESKA